MIKLELDRNTEKLIEEKISGGSYTCPEDVVRAALGALIAAEGYGEFQPGELMRLIEEGERSIQEHGTLDGKEVFQRLRQHLAARGESK
jgi:Arc/MetJ-type ribon-helix-helix transcriptional regulator